MVSPLFYCPGANPMPVRAAGQGPQGSRQPRRLAGCVPAEEGVKVGRLAVAERDDVADLALEVHPTEASSSARPEQDQVAATAQILHLARLPADLLPGLEQLPVRRRQAFVAVELAGGPRHLRALDQHQVGVPTLFRRALPLLRAQRGALVRGSVEPLPELE